MKIRDLCSLYRTVREVMYDVENNHKQGNKTLRIIMEGVNSAIDSAHEMKKMVADTHRRYNLPFFEAKIKNIKEAEIRTAITAITASQFKEMENEYKASCLQSDESIAIIFDAHLATDDSRRAKIVLDYFFKITNHGKAFWQIILGYIENHLSQARSQIEGSATERAQQKVV